MIYLPLSIEAGDCVKRIVEQKSGVVITPWGDASRMKQRRLSPGPGGRRGMSRAEVEGHQRGRLFAAMVAAVAERQYSGSSVEELCRISGVSRTDFYKFFDSREDCFLSTLDELQRLGMEQVSAGYKRAPDWEGGIRAAFDALIEMLVSQPAAGHMYLVDVYEAGVAGNERVKAGLAAFESMLAAGFSRSPQRAGVPAEIREAIVAGVQMVIHDRLRRGAVEELPGLATDLCDWALSYETPPEPLHLVAASATAAAAAAPDPEDGATPERIIVAIAAICADEGVNRVTVGAIAREARISLRTLYQHFPGSGEKPAGEEAFLAAFEEIVGRCLSCSRQAYEGEADWPLRMHAVNRELFAYLASHPAFAKTVLVEVLGAGPAALESRDSVLKPFGELLEAGQRLAPRVPAVVREAIVFAVYSLVGRAIEAGGAEQVTRLVPTATYLELAPYVGAARAATVANGGDEERRPALVTTPTGSRHPA